MTKIIILQTIPHKPPPNMLQLKKDWTLSGTGKLMTGGNMVKIALADDDEEFLELLKQMLEECFRAGKLCCRIDFFRNPELLDMEYAEGRTYDVCFLDIEMRQMDGRELAQRIRERDRAVYLIYLTSHGEFVRDGYRVGAFDFIMKEELCEELPDMMERLLIYIYKQGQNARFVLTSGEKQERISLRRVMEALGDEEFAFVERGYIVNLTHVTSMDQGRVVLSNGTILPAGKEYIQRLRERLGMYSMRRLETMGRS